VEWSVVEEIEPLPTTPNTCEITLRASRAGTEKQVRVRIVSLGSSGRLAERAFVNLAIDENTDEDGFLVFRLPWSSTPGVGKYRVRLLDLDTNEVLHDRVCTVPDEAELDYEDLPGGTLPSGVESTGLLIREVDGTPSGTINTLIVPNGSLTVSGGTGTLDVSSSGGGNTNLSVSTTSTTVVIASDTGTDATIGTASGSAAGIMTAAQFTKLEAITGTNTGDQDLSGLQPLDSDLTAIAALTTTSFGRSLLTQADAAATRTTIGAGTSSFDGAYSSLSGTPSTFTPASHTHGNITNAGAIGSTANLPLITTTSGVVTVGSFGSSANTFCEGNDSRLSDARTPTAHNHAASEITSGTLDNARLGTGNLTFKIDTTTTGAKSLFFRVPYACTITGWELVANTSGSVVVDIWKDTYANFPPAVGDTITASAKPTLTAESKANSTTLTGWTTALAAGDYIEVNVDSVTTITNVTLTLTVTRV
jgi:hypothetical protein